MLNGQKPWVKNIFENFLIILSVLGLTLARIVGKILNGQFGINNLIALSFAIIGLILLVVSKMDNLKQGNYFSFGSTSMSAENRTIYKVAYVCMIVGLLLTFIL